MADSSFYDIEVQDIKGNTHTMADYRNKVLLIVNTASKCGFTPQFDGLQRLHSELGGDNFAVLGFPCNQFLSQDPGSNDEISEFCSLNYGVDFPMFAKLDVNGDAAHPLYQYLKSQAKGIGGSERIKWNFTKFLINQEGKVEKRYPPTAKPESIRADVEKLL